MPNYEKSFADRLARGKRLKEALELIPTYKPIDSTIHYSAFEQLLNEIESKNAVIGSVQSTLTTDIAERKNMIVGAAGLKKLVSRIVHYCKSVNEFKPYMNSVNQVAKKIRNSRTASVKLPAGAVPPTEEKSKRTLGEQSFGDFAKLASDLLEVLRNIPNYVPNSSDISINGLESFLAAYNSLNNSTADKRSTLTNYLWERKNLYEGENGLRDRMKRIKANIVAEYSKDSQEYNAVKDISY